MSRTLKSGHSVSARHMLFPLGLISTATASKCLPYKSTHVNILKGEGRPPSPSFMLVSVVRPLDHILYLPLAAASCQRAHDRPECKQDANNWQPCWQTNSSQKANKQQSKGKQTTVKEQNEDSETLANKQELKASSHLASHDSANGLDNGPFFHSASGDCWQQGCVQDVVAG